MKKILFFSLVLFNLMCAEAQINLKGTIRDAQTKEAINGVVVQVLETNQIAESNAKGEFQLVFQEPGTYSFKYINMAYEELIEEIILEEGKSNSSILVSLKPLINVLQPVEVNALRAGESTPIAYENIDKEEIEKLNTGRDVPYLLQQTPSLVATSDAGAGIGYTNMRIRGSDITRINVTVNGIPINDPESHGVFWVNMPDLASSTNSIQVQRGVGTSTNGSAAFGASLNMETNGPTPKPSGIIKVGAGSFNTQRYAADFGTGLISNNWWMSGRLSSIKSDGYIDRASSNLSSYYLSGGFINDKTSLRAVVFGGKEKTYQAWNGVDSATLATNRTFNSAGAIYDSAWNVLSYYDNEVDNYGQDHYQLHLNQIITDQLKVNVSLHYTKGSGYYEQYKQDQYMPDYGLNPVVSGSDTISHTDLVRRKWLDNDYYGGIFNIEYTNDWMTSILGGGFHQYDGRHYGEVIWARYASQSEIRDQYYNSLSDKTEWNVYWKNLLDLGSNVTAFVDLQIRSVNYIASGTDDDAGMFAFNQANFFFNPKAGLTYRINDRDKVFVSYALANKEPNRTDLIYADPADLPKPETLHDFEFGYEFLGNKFAFKGNAFYMYYVNQLVLTGTIDNVGYPIRKNIGKSYRIGVELAVDWQPLKWLKWAPNVAYIQCQNLDYIEEDDQGKLRPLGNTAIAYSPNTVFASTLEFYPAKGLVVGLFTQYVSQQYLNNSEVERLSLDSYFLNDLNVSYLLNPTWVDGIRIYASVNNLFNTEYSSNGYVWGSTPYYYPQAGINFLAGLEVSF